MDLIVLIYYQMNFNKKGKRLTEMQNAQESSVPSILPYTNSASARERLRRFGHKKTWDNNKCNIRHIPASMQSVTSGVSSGTSSPVLNSVSAGISFSENAYSSNDITEGGDSSNTDSPQKTASSIQKEYNCLGSVVLDTERRETKKAARVSNLESNKNERVNLLLSDTMKSNRNETRNSTHEDLFYPNIELKDNHIIVSATVHRPGMS